MWGPAGSRAHSANRITQRVSQCLCHFLKFHLRHPFYQFLLKLISSPSPHRERLGTFVVCGNCVCAFCSRYQTGGERERERKTCFCWGRHVILMLSRLTETQQSNGIWSSDADINAYIFDHCKPTKFYSFKKYTCVRARYFWNPFNPHFIQL